MQQRVCWHLWDLGACCLAPAHTSGFHSPQFGAVISCCPRCYSGRAPEKQGLYPVEPWGHGYFYLDFKDRAFWQSHQFGTPVQEAEGPRQRNAMGAGPPKEVGSRPLPKSVQKAGPSAPMCQEGRASIPVDLQGRSLNQRGLFLRLKL